MNRSGRRRPLITLTPLIDVVFILLIFFMLASSFLDRRSIELATPARVGSEPTDERTLIVAVRPEGVTLSGETLDLATLELRMRDLVAADPGRRVVVEPAGGATLQATVDVLDRLASAGIADSSLVRGAGR